MMKKELDMVVVSKPMVPNASSKIRRIIDTINGPSPDQVKAEKAKAE